MLSGVSMYAPARSLAALALLLSVLCSVGCDASPGLEPPSRRDGGPSPRPGSPDVNEGAGQSRDAAVNTPGGGASGGPSASSPDAGAPTMSPPIVTPGDDDAGS